VDTLVLEHFPLLGVVVALSALLTKILVLVVVIIILVLILPSVLINRDPHLLLLELLLFIKLFLLDVLGLLAGLLFAGFDR